MSTCWVCVARCRALCGGDRRGITSASIKVQGYERCVIHGGGNSLLVYTYSGLEVMFMCEQA